MEIKITCTGAFTVPLDELLEIQGDLKTLSKINYEKLKNEILTEGFSFTPHVWKSKNKYYLIDCHQRIRTLRKMLEEDYTVPPIPISFVEAKDHAHAKRKVLAATSQYGRIDSDGLLEFLKDIDLDPLEMIGRFDFADLNLTKFVENNFNLIDPKIPIGSPSEIPDDLRHASAQVRMVQLFFGEATHNEFLEIVNHFNSVYGKDNVTDTVLEIMRQSFKNRSVS